GNHQRDLGRPDDAIRSYERALAVYDEQAVLSPYYRDENGWTLLNLGGLLKSLGRVDEARDLLQRSLALHEKQVVKLPTSAYLRCNVIACCTHLGNLDGELCHRDEALRWHRKARELAERLAADYPEHPDYRLELARTENNVGYELTEAGRFDEARRHIEA